MGEKIRVLHIVTSMNVGGLESRLMDIYRFINKSKIQFDFYTLRKTPGYFDEEIRGLGGQVFYNSPLTIKNIHKVQKEFGSFLDQNNYDIIHSHICETSPILLSVAKRKGVNHRIVHSRHASVDMKIKSLYKSLSKFVLKLSIPRYATDYYSVSLKAGYWLFGRKIVDRGLVKVINNAIDASKYRYDIETRTAKRKELLLSDNEIVVGLVGNFSNAKNHDFLVDIFDELTKMNSTVKLVLVGSGTNESQIKKKCEKLGLLGKVNFLGKRNDVNELLQAIDIFVMPSLFEGMPGAAIEAQASGLPLVLSKNITNEAKITSSVLFLGLDQAPKFWAEKVLDLYNQHTRGDTYTEIVKNGYDISYSAKQLESNYLMMI